MSRRRRTASRFERYSVLVLAEMRGVWVWHCHTFTHVERSDGTMFGMLTALIVEE